MGFVLRSMLSLSQSSLLSEQWRIERWEKKPPMFSTRCKKDVREVPYRIHRHWNSPCKNMKMILIKKRVKRRTLLNWSKGKEGKTKIWSQGWRLTTQIMWRYLCLHPPRWKRHTMTYYWLKKNHSISRKVHWLSLTISTDSIFTRSWDVLCQQMLRLIRSVRLRFSIER